MVEGSGRVPCDDGPGEGAAGKETGCCERATASWMKFMVAGEKVSDRVRGRGGDGAAGAEGRWAVGPGAADDAAELSASVRFRAA